jgi:hypothetical protein
MNDKEILREKLLEAVTAHFKRNGDIEYRIDKKTFDNIFYEKERTTKG